MVRKARNVLDKLGSGVFLGLTRGFALLCCSTAGALHSIGFNAPLSATPAQHEPTQICLREDMLKSPFKAVTLCD